MKTTSRLFKGIRFSVLAVLIVGLFAGGAWARGSGMSSSFSSRSFSSPSRSFSSPSRSFSSSSFSSSSSSGSRSSFSSVSSPKPTATISKPSTSSSTTINRTTVVSAPATSTTKVIVVNPTRTTVVHHDSSDGLLTGMMIGSAMNSNNRTVEHTTVIHDGPSGSTVPVTTTNSTVAGSGHLFLWLCAIFGALALGLVGYSIIKRP